MKQKKLKGTSQNSLKIIKHPAFKGQDYPLNNLGDREFELLIVELFSSQIERKEFKGVFDKVLPMNGNKEQGRDAVLYLRNVVVGVIQCKKYGNNITEPQLANEFIKFSLYAYLDNALLPDKAQFHYYLAYPKGLTNTAIDLVGQFNNKFPSSTNLEKWTNKVINDSATFKNAKLTFKKVEEHLKDFGKKVKYRDLGPSNTHKWLAKNPDVAGQFFKIKKVIDNDAIEKLSEKFDAFTQKNESKYSDTASNYSRKNISVHESKSQVESIVRNMGFFWESTGRKGVGLDGKIIVKKQTKNNKFLYAQIYSSDKIPLNPSGEIEVEINNSDLNYWLSGNHAVILIIGSPISREYYFISVREYFDTVSKINNAKVIIRKEDRVFDKQAAPIIRHMAIYESNGLYGGATPLKEELFSNLLLLNNYPPIIYEGETTFRNRKEIIEELKSKNNLSKIRNNGIWILKEKKIFSFNNLNNLPYKVFCQNIKEINTDEWAHSNENDLRNNFRQLLKLSLKEKCFNLRLKLNKDGIYYAKSKQNSNGLIARKHKYNRFGRKSEITVFDPKFTLNPNSQKSAIKCLNYCMHLGFKAKFHFWGDQWYLEKIPTYHYTTNGFDVHPNSEGKLKGKKQLDKHQFIGSQILLWQELLTKKQDMFSFESYLSFSKLNQVTSLYGVNDESWTQKEEKKIEGLQNNTLKFKLNEE